MNIISIDPGKYNIGIFIKWQNENCSMSIINDKEDLQKDIFIKIFDKIRQILSLYSINLGFIEGYAFNFKNKKSIISLGEIGGIIRLIFAKKNIPLIEIPVQTWKNQTISIINKRKYKDLYLKKIKEKYKKKFDNIDEADAFLIYETAMIACKGRKQLSETMQKIKQEIKKAIYKIKSCNF